MKAKSMMLMMIALGCGLVAAIGISQVIVRGGDSDAPRVDTAKILVAMDLIDIAEELTAENVKLEEWPQALIPEGAVRTMEEVEGMYSKARVVKGMAIVNDMLVDEKYGIVPTIPEGYRVTSMKVSIDEALSGLLQPGDRVDITGFFRSGDDQVAKTFLHNVQIFAVNEETERIIDTDGKALMAKTVSMLVTPQQVKKLLVAKRSGNLHLSLRSHTDETDADDGGLVTLTDILDDPSQRGSEDRPEREEETEAAPEDFKSWLDTMATSGAGGAFGGQEKVMVVMTGDGGMTEYRFSDDKSLPVVSGSNGQLAVGAPANSASASSDDSDDEDDGNDESTKENEGDDD